MKKNIATLLLIFIFGTMAFGQTLAKGDPPLTQDVVNRLTTVYERLFDIRLDQTQRAKLKEGVILYWTEGNQAGIKESLSNAGYANKLADVDELRRTSQATFIEGYRRDIAVSNDPVYILIVDAFDRAHPDKRDATRARTFNDLVGTWKRSDALLAGRDPNSGAAVGVSYTDSGTLDISANGAFHLIQAHNHCTTGCCRMDGSEEFGHISIVKGKLDYRIEKGSSLVDDACLGTKQRTAATPSKKSFDWTIRANPNNDATTLCLTAGEKDVQCFERQ